MALMIPTKPESCNEIELINNIYNKNVYILCFECIFFYK